MENDHKTSTIAAPASRPGGESLSDRVRSLRLPDAGGRASRGNTWLPWTLCLILGACTGVLGYVHFASSSADAGRGGAADADGKTAPGSVAGAGSPGAAMAVSGDVVLERKGYVIPAHMILISPKVSGMVEKLHIEEGQRVSKGQILAELETIDYQADYDRARAVAAAAWQKFVELYLGFRDQEIKQAKAEMEEMEAQREQLYLEWKRNTRLQSNSALAARDYEQAASAYKAMERRVERMRQNYQLMLEGPRPERIQGAFADWETAEADCIKARWRLDNCKIRAPVSGTILSKKAELGNLVNPIAMNGSFSLCEMADLSDMEVDLLVEERDIAKVFKGQQCKVRPEAFPDRVYQGVVARLMPTADRSRSAIPVRVKLTVARDEEGVYLKPEMGAVVSFLKKSESGKTN